MAYDTFRFLQSCLYFPLGGNRKGEIRRYSNLMITMLLEGLWHGAGWTFAFWGGLHGGYLIINHAWHHVRRLMGHDLQKSTLWGRVMARGFTFLAIVIGWVYFRAENFESANLILSTMFGFQHASTFGSMLFLGSVLHHVLIWLFALSVLIWIMPNTLQWTSYDEGQHEWKSMEVPQKFRALFQFLATTVWAFFVLR